MSKRLDTTGHQPVVEYRSSADRYFITFPDLKVELAPAFRGKQTAHEIAVNCFYGVPFFMMIPTVPHGTEYPRPGMVMPRIRPVDIGFKVLP